MKGAWMWYALALLILSPSKPKLVIPCTYHCPPPSCSSPNHPLLPLGWTYLLWQTFQQALAFEGSCLLPTGMLWCHCDALYNYIPLWCDKALYMTLLQKRAWTEHVFYLCIFLEELGCWWTANCLFKNSKYYHDWFIILLFLNDYYNPLL